MPGLLLSNRVIDRAEPSILDIAPTILEMFGVKPPPYMDGRTLFDAPLRLAGGKEARAWKAVASS